MRGRTSDKRECDVAGAWWHVDEQEVRLVPPCLGDELFDCLVQHRTTPDDRLFVGHEVAHRHTAHAVGERGDDRVTEHDGIVQRTEHLGQREAVDVGVEHANLVAECREGDGEVDRHRGLAHPALARGDAEHTGLGQFVEELRCGVAVAGARVARHGAAQKVSQGRVSPRRSSRAPTTVAPGESASMDASITREIGPTSHRQRQLDAHGAALLVDDPRGNPVRRGSARAGAR